MNKYQGIYLRRGEDVMTDADGTSVTSEYRADFIEQDELVTLTTNGRFSVTYTNRVRRGEGSSPGDVNMELQFNDNDECTVTSIDGDPYDVTGTGRFVDDGDEWGGKKRDVIYLNYQYTDTINDETHAVMDTLVIRNRDVKFEEFIIELTEED